MEPTVLLGLLAAAFAAGAVVGVATLARRRPGTAAAPAGTPRPPVGPVAEPERADVARAIGTREVAALVDSIGIGVVLLDRGLSVTLANDAACRLLGRRVGSLTGGSLMEAFTDHRIDTIVRAALDGGAATGEVTIRTSVAPVVVIRARRAEIGGLWVTLEDVSELRRLQRIRAEFIDNISHELRTPLTTVSLLAETLALEADRLPARTAERISKIRVETDHLVQMVNELLDLSRIEGGSAHLVLDEVDLPRLARATVDRIALFAERQGVGLAIDAPPDIPAVRGDGERLGQALLNLVHNAVKFSPPGSQVTVHVSPDEAEVVVAVEDHGPGIPRAALPRVFERFYKVDRARVRSGGGTGLGLSIARHIVEGHGGRIWVRSVEGAGATFAFAVPIRGPELAATAGG